MCINPNDGWTMRCFVPNHALHLKHSWSKVGQTPLENSIQKKPSILSGIISETHSAAMPDCVSIIFFSVHQLVNVFRLQVWTRRCVVGKRQAIMLLCGSN